MAKKKRLKESVHLTFHIDKDQLEWMRHLSFKLSIKEGKMISIAQLIRDACETAYPVPKNQKEFFK